MNTFSLKYNPLFQLFNNLKLVDNSILLDKVPLPNPLPQRGSKTLGIKAVGLSNVNRFQYNTHFRYLITSKRTLAG